MSWDIHIEDPQTGETLSVAHHDIKGGTHAMGGTDEAWLNISYNYSAYYYDAVSQEKGFRVIDGMTVGEAMPVICRAIQKIGTTIRDADYWEATAGNAGAALLDLLTLMSLCPPDAKIRVS
jgi:hypothetical protein